MYDNFGNPMNPMMMGQQMMGGMGYGGYPQQQMYGSYQQPMQQQQPVQQEPAKPTGPVFSMDDFADIGQASELKQEKVKTVQ